MGCIESMYAFKYLSGENLEFLKASTGYDESTIKQMHKMFMKECPNGRLTPNKFIDLYKLFIWRGNAEMYCEHVFRTFDTDQNGFIDFGEFLVAMYVTSAGSAEEKLTWAFRMYDVDGNGVIDPYEMCKVVEAIYGMLCEDATEPKNSAKKKAMKILLRMDENQDGHLTKEEFLRGCLEDDELSKLLAPNMVECCK